MEKREHGHIQGLTIFGCPSYLMIGKDTNFISGQNICRVHPNKSPVKLLEEREHGLNFLDTPFISGTGKATDKNFQGTDI